MDGGDPEPSSRIEWKLDEINRKCDMTLLKLDGPPDQPWRGLMTRVDRLEQESKRDRESAKTRNGFIVAAFVTALGALIESVFGFFRHKS